MPTYPFQAVIIGKDNIQKQKTPYWKWGFLYEMAKVLTESQAIRLVLPVEQNPIALKQVWYRIFPGNAHTRKVQQADGSHVIYLWYDGHRE